MATGFPEFDAHHKEWIRRFDRLLPSAEEAIAEYQPLSACDYRLSITDVSIDNMRGQVTAFLKSGK
jgi:hypothetical protein